jgi:hypothetical protein
MAITAHGAVLPMKLLDCAGGKTDSAIRKLTLFGYVSIVSVICPSTISAASSTRLLYYHMAQMREVLRSIPVAATDFAEAFPRLQESDAMFRNCAKARFR